MFVNDTNPGPLFFVARFPQGYSLGDFERVGSPFLRCPQGYELGVAPAASKRGKRVGICIIH
jgi:hypothetical protein